MHQSGPVVIRLALVDSQTLFREGLRALVDREPDLEVVADAPSTELLASFATEPDVVVTGLETTDESPDEVVKHTRTRFRHAAILVLSFHADVATIRGALADGAHGYVLKSAGTAELLTGIRAVSRGGLYLQPSIGIAVASRPPRELDRSTVDGLTPKETEVLELLALGHTNAEIAARLGSGIRTIETHRAHVHQRLDLHTRAELVRYALDAGLLRLDAHDART